MKSFFRHIHSSKQLQLIFWGGLLVQLLFCITSVGYFHPDQHFQILEFSSYQLGKPNAAGNVWELAKHIRPTIQVYFFSGFRICCEWLSITNPFTQLTILRLIQGMILFIIFNWMSFVYCKKNQRNLAIVLLLINFTWVLPYTRTLFSSELFSALVFFPAIVYFHQQYLQQKADWVLAVSTGFFLAISFFLRFQMVFAIAGFGIWLLFFEKQFKLTVYLVLGFIAGTALNVLLDYGFYHQWEFTPYLYFKTNLLDGVAASFGEKSFTYYLGILLVVVAAPPLSIFLFYRYCKTSIILFKHPLVLSCLLFIIGHCCVGHKEERFMFSIINAMPVIIGLSSTAFDFYFKQTKWATLLKAVTYFSIFLNVVLLITFLFTPYSQTIAFDKKLKETFDNTPAKIYCYTRTPLQTESHLPLKLYESPMQNLELININNIDSINKLNSGTTLLCGTYNDLKEQFGLIDSLHYKPTVFSSGLLWNINLLLDRRKMNTINDIWVLYKK